MAQAGATPEQLWDAATNFDTQQVTAQTQRSQPQTQGDQVTPPLPRGIPTGTRPGGRMTRPTGPSLDGAGAAGATGTNQQKTREDLVREAAEYTLSERDAVMFMEKYEEVYREAKPEFKDGVYQKAFTDLAAIDKAADESGKVTAAKKALVKDFWWKEVRDKKTLPTLKIPTPEEKTASASADVAFKNLEGEAERRKVYDNLEPSKQKTVLDALQKGDWKAASKALGTSVVPTAAADTYFKGLKLTAKEVLAGADTVLKKLDPENKLFSGLSKLIWGGDKPDPNKPTTPTTNTNPEGKNLLDRIISRVKTLFGGDEKKTASNAGGDKSPTNAGIESLTAVGMAETPEAGNKRSEAEGKRATDEATRRETNAKTAKLEDEMRRKQAKTIKYT